MFRRVIAVSLGLLLNVAAFAGCSTDTQTADSDKSSSQISDHGQIAFNAAKELIESVIADIKAGKEPVQSEYNSEYHNGLSVLNAYTLFVKPDTIVGNNLKSVQVPTGDYEYYIFSCDVSGESVKAGKRFSDEATIYIKLDSAGKVAEKDWTAWHCSDVYFSDKNLKAFLEYAAKSNPAEYAGLYNEGTDQPPSQEQIDRYQKYMKDYTDKYDLSSFSMTPVDISSDDSFFIKYKVTDAKNKTFEITTTRGDGMVYPSIHVEG